VFDYELDWWQLSVSDSVKHVDAPCFMLNLLFWNKWRSSQQLGSPCSHGK